MRISHRHYALFIKYVIPKNKGIHLYNHREVIKLKKFNMNKIALYYLTYSPDSNFAN